MTKARNAGSEDRDEYTKSAKELEAAEEAEYAAGRDLHVPMYTPRIKGVLHPPRTTRLIDDAKLLRNQKRPMSREQAEDEVVGDSNTARMRIINSKGVGVHPEDAEMLDRVDERRKLNNLKSSGGPR